MAGEAFAGTDGRVTVEGVELNLEKWSVEATVGDIKTTNFESQGYAERIGGIREAKISASGFWDGDQNPSTDPPDIRVGEILSNVLLYVSASQNILWTFPTVLCTSVKIDDDVEQRVNFSFEAASTGIFYYPGHIAA